MGAEGGMEEAAAETTAGMRGASTEQARGTCGPAATKSAVIARQEAALKQMHIHRRQRTRG